MVYLFLGLVLLLVVGLNMGLVRLVGGRGRSRSSYLLAAIAAGGILGGWLAASAAALSTAADPVLAIVRGAGSGAAGGLIIGLGILAVTRRGVGRVPGQGGADEEL